MEQVRRKNVCTYVLLSLAFIIVNLITLSNLAPWIDEVMMLDTSYNMAVHGRWETTAWYRVAGQYPFSTYPPLYQLLAAIWMRLFGTSLTAVRSMNLLLTFLLGGVCLRLMKRHGLLLSPWTTALFTLLLWGTCEMAWMYRNGRPDMLCALIVTTAALAWQASRGWLVVSTALLLCSGIQATVCLFALWLFFFMVDRTRRKEYLRLLVLLLTGTFLGMLAVSLFMMAHGRLSAFVTSIVQYSDTLSAITLALLPWAGDTFGFDATPYTQKLFSLTNKMSLWQRLLVIAEYRSFLILSDITLVAYISRFRNSLHKLLSDKGFLLLLCALYMPVVMVLAGRFPAYYRWMAFLPLVASITIIAARSRRWRTTFSVAAIALAAFGIKSMLPDEQSSYDNLQSFVKRQNFNPSDVVVCPFSMFYEIKPVCDTCYFVGIFPTEYISPADYIIEATDGDEFDQRITDYLNELKADPALTLTVIDRLEHPSLTVYKIIQVSQVPNLRNLNKI